jgi:hypothetical protein
MTDLGRNRAAKSRETPAIAGVWGRADEKDGSSTPRADDDEPPEVGSFSVSALILM